MIDINPFISSGLIPLPVSATKKAPAGGFSQAEWYRQNPDPAEIQSVWDKYGRGADGVALICGHGIELIDIDVKNDPARSIHERYFNAIAEENPDLFNSLVIARTQSGGAHIWLRLSEECDVRPSQALAEIEYSAADQFEMMTDHSHGVVIETRGKGGYGLCPPSPGYDILKGDLFNIPTISRENRELLFDIARSFNTWVKPVSYIPGDTGGTPTSDRPGDAFSESCSPQEMVNILEEAGWKFLSTRGNIIYLNRPGAPHKHTSGIILADKRMFVNYSTSVAEFNPGAGYSFWRTYAITKHGGDFKAAARALSEKGYGKTESYVPRTSEPSSPQEIKDKYAHLRFDINKKPKFNFDFFVDVPKKTPYGDEERYGVAFPGALIPVVGKQKSRKTTVLTGIAAAALTGTNTIRFIPSAPKKVLWCDTEQPEVYFWRTQWRIVVQAYGCIDGLHSYWLRSMSPKERMVAIKDLVALHKPDVLVIDGIADIFLSMNKEEVVLEVVDQWLMPIADQGITVFPVLHLNKGDNNMAGWIGTILGKKSDGTIQVEPDGDNVVIVKMRDARAEPFPAFMLRTDKGMYGIMYDPEQGKPAYDYSDAIDDWSNSPDLALEEDIGADITDEDIPF